jgi:hypothetical protein
MKFFASPILRLAVIPVTLFVTGCSEKTPQAPELLEQETQPLEQSVSPAKTPQAPELLEQETQPLEQSVSPAEMFMLSAKCNEMVIQKFRASWDIFENTISWKSQLGRSLRCYGFQKMHKTDLDRGFMIKFVLIDGLTGEVLEHDEFAESAPDEFLIGVEEWYTKKMAE